MKSSIRSPWTFWLVSFGLSILVDQLFWKKPGGVSFLVWITTVVAAGLVLAVREGVRPTKRSYLLAVAVLALALMTFLRREDLTVVLSVLASLGLLLLLAGTLRTGNWTSYRLVDYLTSLFWVVVSSVSRPFELIKNTAQSDSQNQQSGVRRSIGRQMGSVGLGLVLALPVILVLASLLSSADSIFADQLKAIFYLFNIEYIPEYIFRLIYILFFGFVFTGTLLHAVWPKRTEEAPDTNKPALSPFLGFTESTVVLLCVDLLFLVFVIIQFRYLFGGQNNITSTGYTYSDYARKGFFELVEVAVLSLSLYLGLSTITRNSSALQKRAFSILSALLMAQVLVILASALMRLLLYEEAYGFTRLRTYTHIFIPWLGLLLAITILLELLHRRGRFALALLTCLFGFVFSLGVIGVDGLIVRLNVQRSQAGSELDGQYLTSLSTDAVPGMIEYFTDPSLPKTLHDELGTSLTCRAYLVDQQARFPQSWTAAHYADRTARRLLAEHAADWSAYPAFYDSQNILQVKVNGKYQPCITYRNPD